MDAKAEHGSIRIETVLMHFNFNVEDTMGRPENK